MKDICHRTTHSLSSVDLDVFNYHRGCYQNFTKTLNHLKGSVTSIEASASRSPGKRQCCSTQLFPAERTFCENLEVKVSGRTKRCSKFAVFKK